MTFFYLLSPWLISFILEVLVGNGQERYTSSPRSTMHLLFDTISEMLTNAWFMLRFCTQNTGMVSPISLSLMSEIYHFQFCV